MPRGVYTRMKVRARCKVCKEPFKNPGFIKGHYLKVHPELYGKGNAAKSRHDEVQRNGHSNGGEVSFAAQEEARLAYLTGRIEQWIKDYSESSGIPESTIGYRVGTFLQAKARGQILRAVHPVPVLRRAPAKRAFGKSTLALAEYSHSSAA